MFPILARIALVAYVVGGIAIPSMHHHAHHGSATAGIACAAHGHAHHGEHAHPVDTDDHSDHGSHSEHGAHCDGHADHRTASASHSAPLSGASDAGGVRAVETHTTDACHGPCVICQFSQSGQQLADRSPSEAVRPPASGGAAVAASPEFSLPEISIAPPRGPPADSLRLS